MLQTTECLPGLFLLDDGRVRQFLFVGEDSALLVDTGFPDSHVKEAAQKLTGKPLQVLMTHGDFDHTGGLPDFDECWIHEGDWPLVQAPIAKHPIAEGDRFSCGAFTLEAILIPGHTHGSVAFFEEAHGLLLPGDSVQQEGPIYLSGEHRDLGLYIQSLEKLLAWAPRTKAVLPCHHSCPIGPQWIEKDLEDARALAAGQLTGVPQEGRTSWVYQGKWTSFLGEAPETSGKQ